MTINLLPPELKQEKKTKKITGMIVLFLTGVLLILLIVIGGIVTSSLFTKRDTAKIEEKIADQNRLLLRYKETEDNTKSVNDKLAKIDSATGTRILWSNILVELSKNTPSNVQIKTLTLNQEGNKINMSGYAETRSDIAKFKEKLESSKYFQNVTFSSSVRNEEQANFSYNISCELKGAQQ